MARKHAPSQTSLVPKPDRDVESPTAETQAARLQQLEAAILEGHQRSTLLLVGSAVTAMKTGQYAIEAKALLGHGRFTSWMVERLVQQHGIAQRTVERYMHLAKHKGEILQRIHSVYADGADARVTLEQAQEVLQRLRIQDAVSLLRWSDSNVRARGSSSRSLKPLMTSSYDEYLTPPEVVNIVTRFAGGLINLDPCAEEAEAVNVPAELHFTKNTDGLDPNNNWAGFVYLNPPYGNAIKRFVARAVKEFIDGNIEAAVLLLPSRTDSEWFSLLNSFPRVFIRGRLKFRRADRPEAEPSSAPFPSVLVGVIPEQKLPEFYRVFHVLGPMFVPYSSGKE